MLQANQPSSLHQERHPALPIAEARENEHEDWSFAHLTPSARLWGPHGYHRYPAKFIPQLVRRIIERYSLPGDRVGDPFLGSATTGIEALRTGRYFYGSDIHPVALLISHAKCTPIDPAHLYQIWNTLEQALVSLPHEGKRGLTEKELTYISSINISRATGEERLAYWFPQTYQTILSQILKHIQAISEDKARTFFLCAFSNILRSCSIWLSGSTKPQKDLRKILANPVEEFRKQVKGMLKRNALYWEDLKVHGLLPELIEPRLTITSDDARCLALPDAALDLLVTSPPYATCYEYSEMHQLTQLWFEKYRIFPKDRILHSCIGTKSLAHRKGSNDLWNSSTGSFIADQALIMLCDSSSGSKASDIRQEARALYYYFVDMYAAIQQFARVVTPYKWLALIIGDSYRLGLVIPTSDALCEMAEAAGFCLEQRIVRQVPGRVLVATRDKKTGRFTSSAQSDIQVYPEEYVLLFQRRP